MATVLPVFLTVTPDELEIIYNNIETTSQRLHTTQSRLPQNITYDRDRFIKIGPFKENRFHLNVPTGKSDYINASPIMLKQSNGVVRHWVATQFPRFGDENIAVFWRMIVDLDDAAKQDLSCKEKARNIKIVMLTAPMKKFTYFPTNMSGNQDITKTSLSLKSQAELGADFEVQLQNLRVDKDLGCSIRDIVVRTVNSEADPKSACYPDCPGTAVTHYIFTEWPDHSIPEDNDQAGLLKLVRQTQADQMAPLVVHCRAGIGRTGTFIALDYLLYELDHGAWDNAEKFQGRDEEKIDPVAEVVGALREQRMLMVEEKKQFGFLYEVLRKEWCERQEKI